MRKGQSFQREEILFQKEKKLIKNFPKKNIYFETISFSEDIKFDAKRENISDRTIWTNWS